MRLRRSVLNKIKGVSDGLVCVSQPFSVKKKTKKNLPQINNPTKERRRLFRRLSPGGAPVFVLTGLHYSPSPAVFTVLIQSAA